MIGFKNEQNDQISKRKKWIARVLEINEIIEFQMIRFFFTINNLYLFRLTLLKIVFLLQRWPSIWLNLAGCSFEELR